MTTASRSRLFVLFFTVFLDLLGFGMVIPILPLYAVKLHASDLQIGQLLAIYSLMQLVFAPVWGRLSDRFGRRPVLLISIFGSCASQLGYALAPSFLWLVAARGLAGVCGANISAAQAYVADVTDERSRAGGMALLGAALGLGFIFGPAVGGFLSAFDDRLPFFVASGCAALNFLLAAVLLVEPRPARARSSARVLTWSSLVRTLSSPRLAALMLLLLVVTFAFANLESAFTLYLQRRFGFGRRGASFLFTYIGAIMVLVQGLLVRRLVGRLGERRLVIVGTLLMAAGMGLLYLAYDLPILLLAVALVSVGNGCNTPSLSSLISRTAADQQGGVLGVSQSLGALARVLAPLVSTWALGFGVGVPFAIGGLLMALASAGALALVQQPREHHAGALASAASGAPPA